MLQFDFTSNPNGKLFNSLFGDIRVHDHSYKLGEEYEIHLNSLLMGHAIIERIRIFPFARISDVAALLNCGLPAVKQAALLNRFYNNSQMLPGDTMLAHIVLRYTYRNMEVQDALMEDYWKEIRHQNQQTNY